MFKRFSSLFKLLISIGLAAFLLFLVFRNVEWAEFWERARRVNYWWVVLSILLSFVAYAARAYRWNILLRPLGYDLKTSRTTLAVLVGYLANLAIPRMGEITRCGVLQRNDNVPLSAGLGSVVSERIIDMITLLFLILVSLTLESDRLISFLNSAYQDLEIPGYVVWIIVGAGAVGFTGFVVVLKVQKKLRGKFGDFLRNFMEGLLSLRRIKSPAGFVLSTIIIWVVYYLMSYLIVFSLPETSHLGLGAGFMLLITGGIAIALPVQSGFGTYHGMIAGMLLLYSIDETTGIFLATLLHTSQIFTIALFGTIALIFSVLIRRKKATVGLDK